MTVVVITPPPPILTQAEVKAHLRVDHGDEDALIDALIATAQAHLSGPGGWLGRSIGEQTLELRIARCAASVALPYPPFRDVSSVTYLDPEEVEQTIAITDINVVSYLCRSVALWPKAGCWPGMASRPDALRIRYSTGYLPADPEFAPIRAAMLLLIGHWYANREAASDAQKVAPLPFGVEALLSPLRVWSL